MPLTTYAAPVSGVGPDCGRVGVASGIGAPQVDGWGAEAADPGRYRSTLAAGIDRRRRPTGRAAAPTGPARPAPPRHPAAGRLAGGAHWYL
ncbi:hypothetical protein GCM10010124_32330 [Pilimelia terevasa]|uniref:Uncharacterized protein n=1 Tax=Pilimelia terevasa TaxID=53372 RepID=A0A8J3BP46_9ACTN|nr:hypothetical protein GCM10010124_32330 [Pilimelia terevasa]